MLRSFPFLVAVALLLLAITPPASGQINRQAPGEAAIEDVLQILLLERELIALDAVGGGGPRERLEIGEKLLWKASRGRVGVVMTDRRMLAVGVASGSWQEKRYRHGESPPRDALLGDRVAVWVTPKRVFGFDGGSGNLIVHSLGPHERLLRSQASANVAVLVTDRQALGFSPFVGGFSSTGIRVGEKLEEVQATGNFATVLTSRRLLTYRAPTGGWEERNRNLR